MGVLKKYVGLYLYRGFFVVLFVVVDVVVVVLVEDGVVMGVLVKEPISSFLKNICLSSGLKNSGVLVPIVVVDAVVVVVVVDVDVGMVRMSSTSSMKSPKV